MNNKLLTGFSPIRLPGRGMNDFTYFQYKLALENSNRVESGKDTLLGITVRKQCELRGGIEWTAL